MDSLKVGQLFHERYLISEKLGSGGMGTVYKATQTDITAQVAIKALNTSLLSSKEQRSRFLREFRILAQLSNEHIVTFYSAAISPEGVPYAVFEYIDGLPLSNLLSAEGPLPWQRSLLILKQVCLAIEAAHEIGVTHRDLKPENIMLLSKPHQDFVKVVDFGLSHIESQDQIQKLTNTGELVGSIHYMSPEQCAGQTVDLRTDIYALGCVMYKCLTAEFLFDADSAIGILHLHTKADNSERLKKLEANCPQTLISVISKMLEKIPAARHQSIKELMADLSTISDDDTITITSPIASTSLKRQAASPIAFQVIAALLLSLLLVFIAWLLFTDDGIVLQAKLSLSNNQSRDNAFYWLKRSEIMMNSGKIQAPRELRAELCSIISKNTQDSMLSATLFAEMAESCNDASASIDLATESLQLISKAKSGNLPKIDQLISRSTKVIERNAHKINVPQLKLLNQLNAQLVSLDLYKAIVPELRKREIPINKEFALALAAEAIAYAKAGQWEKVQDLRPIMEVSLNNAFGEFTFSRNEITLAQILVHEKNQTSIELVKSLAKRAVDVFKKYESPEALDMFFDNWLKAVDCYASLNDYDEMFSCADSALRIAKDNKKPELAIQVYENIDKPAELIIVKLTKANQNKQNKVLKEALAFLERELPASSPYFIKLAQKAAVANRACNEQAQANYFQNKAIQ